MECSTQQHSIADSIDVFEANLGRYCKLDKGTDFVGRSVVMGALTLYLDFINLFLFLLRFMGDRR